MSNAERDDLDQALRRLQELITALEAHSDPAAREPARELLGLVLDLHGIGLAKLMTILSSAEGGRSIVAQLVENDQVRAMLLLHGLHPDDFETRVRRAVEHLRPHLGVHGLRLEVAGITGGEVRLRVTNVGGRSVEPAMLFTLPGEIENAILEAAPDAAEVRIDGLETASVSAAIHAAE